MGEVQWKKGSKIQETSGIEVNEEADGLAKKGASSSL